MVSAQSDMTFKKLPGAMALSRGLVISDATFYNEIAGEFMNHPVQVMRHGIRGTQNLNKEEQTEVSNLQMTDTAKTAANADAMVVMYSLKFLPMGEEHRCSIVPKKGDVPDEISGVRASLNDFVARAKGSEGLKEVSRRLARNIANGRALWRNRTIAAGIETTVYRHEGAQAPDLSTMEPLAAFDSLSIPLQHFNDYSADERALGEVIAMNLSGEAADALVVVMRVSFGMLGSIEVFPSQNYLDMQKEAKRGFARSLYCLGGAWRNGEKGQPRVMGHAAMRDQKISNALRTIDTWYPSDEEPRLPIAVEPNGASLSAQKFYRPAAGPHSAFKLFRRLNQVSPDTEEGMFCIASLLRGGVFSE